MRLFGGRMPMQREVDGANTLQLTSFAHDTPGSGTTTVVAGNPGKKIVVLQLALISSTAQNAQFYSDSTAVTGAFPVGTNGGMVLPYSGHGWFQTAAGEALKINLSSASAGYTLVWCYSNA